MRSRSDEIHNFLNTTWMGIPLYGCKALSTCTNVLGLRPVGWSVRLSIRRSFITFAETLKTKEMAVFYLAKLRKNLARTHFESEQCPLCIL
jgi:hypothetical protein